VIAPSLNIFPNPVSGDQLRLQLASPVSEVANLLIVDVLGQTLEQIEVPTNSTVDVPFSHPPGVYLVKVQSQNTLFTTRFVKQ
jgi:hypothetical protein